MRTKLLAVTVVLLILALAGCGAAGTTAATAGGSAGVQVVTASVTSPEQPLPADWELAPFSIPILPAQLPAVGAVDPATGLHVNVLPSVDIDLSSYRLVVDGKVARPLSLSYDDLRSMTKITASPDLLCAGNFIDKATWSGASLREILEMSGIQPEAKEVSLIAADGYSAEVDLDEALDPKNFLAYELSGRPLPVLHGFPLRAVFPGLTGYRWVKWLVEISVR